MGVKEKVGGFERNGLRLLRGAQIDILATPSLGIADPKEPKIQRAKEVTDQIHREPKISKRAERVQSHPAMIYADFITHSTAKIFLHSKKTSGELNL